MICVVSDGAESCQACPAGQYADTASSCVPIPGEMIAHDFGVETVGPGEEDDSSCKSWTLNNEAEIWFNAIEMTNEGSYHHSNWTFTTDTEYPGPDGTWPCADRNWDEVSSSISGGTLFAQSTQVKRQVQKFPEGAAVRLPPHARIIGNTHLLNLSPDTVTTDFQIRIFAIDRADVEVPLAPFALSYRALHIQPGAITNVTGECDVSAVIPGGTPGDLDVDLYYVMPHYHALGRSFRLERLGGASDGEVLYDLGEYDSEAHSKTFDPPVSLRNSEGLRFGCGYDNPYSVEVTWGIGAMGSNATPRREMCDMLGFVRSNYGFVGLVPPNDPTVDTLVSQSDGIYNYSYACAVAPFDFTSKFGGL